MATSGRKASHISQSLMRTTDSYGTGDKSLSKKESRDQNMQTFLRSNCLGQVSRTTWLFLAEKFGRFLSWNELTCKNKGIFFGVAGNLRGNQIATGHVTKEYWFFEICAGAPNICSVQKYDASGKKLEDGEKKDGKMYVFADSCGNVTNKEMQLYMSWNTFIKMPPLPLPST